jgi:hypothetical protein
MKSHVLSAEHHDDDDECPETAEPITDISGSGGVVIEAPETDDGDRDRDA